MEAPDHLTNRLLLAGGVQVNNDRFANDEVRELHPPLRRPTANRAGPNPASRSPRTRAPIEPVPGKAMRARHPSWSRAPGTRRPRVEVRLRFVRTGFRHLRCLRVIGRARW